MGVNNFTGGKNMKKEEKVYHCPLCSRKMFKCELLNRTYYCCSHCDGHFRVGIDPISPKKIEFDGLGVA